MSIANTSIETMSFNCEIIILLTYILAATFLSSDTLSNRKRMDLTAPLICAFLLWALQFALLGRARTPIKWAP